MTAMPQLQIPAHIVGKALLVLLEAEKRQRATAATEAKH
jgi:hypothetical protein